MCVRAVVAKTMIEEYSVVQIYYINGRLAGGTNILHEVISVKIRIYAFLWGAT